MPVIVFSFSNNRHALDLEAREFIEKPLGRGIAEHQRQRDGRARPHSLKMVGEERNQKN
jgi:hypothetical protein